MMVDGKTRDNMVMDTKQTKMEPKEWVNGI